MRVLPSATGPPLSGALRRQPVTNRTTEVPVPREARCGFVTTGQAVAKTPIAESSLSQAVNLGIGPLRDPAAGAPDNFLSSGGLLLYLHHTEKCTAGKAGETVKTSFKRLSAVSFFLGFLEAFGRQIFFSSAPHICRF